MPLNAVRCRLVFFSFGYCWYGFQRMFKPTPGRGVLPRLVFGQKLAYVKNEGFRTCETTLPFKALGGFSDSDSCLAPPRRFERPT